MESILDIMVVCYPRDDITETMVEYTNGDRYKAWMRIDNLITTHASDNDFSVIVRNRSGCRFFYKHINTSGKSLWGPTKPTNHGTEVLTNAVVVSMDPIDDYTEFLSSGSLLLALKLHYEGELPDNIML
jgi:hypothetical protein